MENYEYKVESIQAAVTAADLAKGIAGSKVSSQVEIKLKELSSAGYEYYREFNVNVSIQRGCFGKKSSADSEVTIIVMVFRRPVR